MAERQPRHVVPGHITRPASLDRAARALGRARAPNANGLSECSLKTHALYITRALAPAPAPRLGGPAPRSSHERQPDVRRAVSCTVHTSQPREPARRGTVRGGGLLRPSACEGHQRWPRWPGIDSDRRTRYTSAPGMPRGANTILEQASCVAAAVGSALQQRLQVMGCFASVGDGCRFVLKNVAISNWFPCASPRPASDGDRWREIPDRV